MVYDIDFLVLRKNGRLMCTFKDELGNKKLVSYPRLILEQKLNRKLKDNEEAHHIDGNYLNNQPENLEAIDKTDHLVSHFKKYVDREMICPVCGNKFIWKAKSQSDKYTNIKRNSLSGPFCSKHCAGVASTDIYYEHVPNDKYILPSDLLFDEQYYHKFEVQNTLIDPLRYADFECTFYNYYDKSVDLYNLLYPLNNINYNYNLNSKYYINTKNIEYSYLTDPLI